jgi:hypothetical protein
MPFMLPNLLHGMLGQLHANIPEQQEGVYEKELTAVGHTFDVLDNLFFMSHQLIQRVDFEPWG